MPRRRPRPEAHDPAVAEAERRVLRFIQYGERHRPPGWPRPAYAIGNLASRLELEHDVCCRALYWLVHRGDLRVEILPGDWFRLIPASLDPADQGSLASHDDRRQSPIG